MSYKVKRPKQNKDKNLHNSFYNTIIAQRAARVLAQKEQEFMEAHGKDTEAELIMYFCNEALQLGHAPREKEIIGWKYLLERFGSWDRLVLRAHLKPYPVEEPEYEYSIIKKERDRQVELHKERKRKRKIKAAQRRKQQEQKKRDQELWLAEHPEQARRKRIKKLKQDPAASEEKPV